MHELSMIRRVLEMAFDVSEAHERRPIRGITLEIGVLQQVMPDALEFAFEAATRGTRAEGARLEWRIVPLEVLCQNCEMRYTPENEFWSCPACGGVRAAALRGNELNLVQVELLDASPGENP